MRHYIPETVCVIACLLSVAVGTVLADDTVAVAKARAQALLLTQAHAVPYAPNQEMLQGKVPCVADFGEACRRQEAEGKYLFIWVGGCVAEVRDLLPEVVHYHTDSYQGSSTPRLIVPTTAGNYLFDRDSVDEATIRRNLNLAKVSQPSAALIPPALVKATPKQAVGKSYTLLQDGTLMECADGKCSVTVQQPQTNLFNQPARSFLRR